MNTPENTSSPADPQAELRARWKAMLSRQAKARKALEAAGLEWWQINARLPREDWRPFADLRCGARSKRTGEPCKLKSIYACGRCKFHGGMSTGPKTAEGKATASRNGKAKG